VRRLDPAEAVRGGPLLRERIALELARARLLLLRGEGAAAVPLLDALRREIAANFTERDANVARALATLDEIRVAPLAPNLPALGESRRELTRLRDAVAGRSSPSAEPATALPVPADASGELPLTQPPAEALPVEPPAAVPDAPPAAPTEAPEQAPDSTPTPTDI